MINDLVQQSDFPRNNANELDQLELNQRSRQNHTAAKFPDVAQTLNYPKRTQFNGKIKLVAQDHLLR
jgi:hypothetical protein